MQSRYPLRSFIRFNARNQLLADCFGSGGITITTRQTGIVRVSGDASFTNTDAADRSKSPGQEEHSRVPTFDENLFQVVAATVLHPCRNPDVYNAYDSAELVHAIEDRVSQEIISTYRRMQFTAQAEVVDQLNRLL